jgi:peptide/nickel transport system substrate-binding protein
VNLFTYPGGRIITVQLNQKRRPEFRVQKVRQAIVTPSTTKASLKRS